ncbi:hypothetical protein LCGC14_2781380 [marine sediment metagenome]|uniref:Uncharacterized protein n=1 Tax=marine sediment metagenome TaxID=412755 RepID=A0A0F8YT62_9ZZZZ
MTAEKIQHEDPPRAHKETGATEKKDYADPSRYKYPVHTEKNTRAALAYFSKQKNRGGYSPEEVKRIARKIIAAAKKFKIDVDEDTYKTFGLRKGIEEMGERIEKEGKLITLEGLRVALEMRKR